MTKDQHNKLIETYKQMIVTCEIYIRDNLEDEMERWFWEDMKDRIQKRMAEVDNYFLTQLPFME